MYREAQAKPFHFKNLPAIRRADLQFFDTISTLTSHDPFTDEFRSQLTETLQKYLRAPLEWSWTGQDRLLSFAQLKQFCMPPTMLVQVALLPYNQRVLVELEPRFTSVLIDRTLGGNGENIIDSRNITDVEKGILDYLLLKVLHTLYQHWGQHLQVDFRLESIEFTVGAFEEMFEDDTQFYRKELRVTMQNSHSLVRVHVPVPLIHEIGNHHIDSQSDEDDSQFIRSRLHRVAEVPVTGGLRVGIVELTGEDLAGLEEEDIVLLSECSAHRQENGLLHGEAILEFSQHPNYGIRCTIHDESNPLRSSVCLEEIIHIAQPEMTGELNRSEYDMSENHEDYEDSYHEEGGEDNLGEMGPVVNDLSVPMVVELGRLEYKARDIMHLRLGQTLELRRSPYEPLDLVVNGQLLGKGELVEIEGQLGVRIIELLK